MSPDLFREMIRQRPFVPLTLHIADGRHITVRHPELVAMSSSGRAAVVIEPSDRIHLFDMLMITDIEAQLESPTTETGSNGPGTRPTT